MTDAPVKADRDFLDQALDDIRDLLAHASERADLAKADPTLAHDAAAVLHPGADRSTSEFYAAAISVLDRLSTIAYPATANGMRLARNVVDDPGSREAREFGRSRFRTWVVLAVAMAVYGYVACGALIVRKIEDVRGQQEQAREQMRTIAGINPSVLDPQFVVAGLPAAPAGDRQQPDVRGQPADRDARQQDVRAPQPDRPSQQAICSKLDAESVVRVRGLMEYCRLWQRDHDLGTEFEAAHNRLHEWRDAFFSPGVFWAGYASTDVICFSEARLVDQYAAIAPAEHARFSQHVIEDSDGHGRFVVDPACFFPPLHLASRADLVDNAYEYRQRREQQARAILDSLSTIVLPMLFGLLGAMLAHVRELYVAINQNSIDHAMFGRRGLHYLLGLVLGTIVGVLFSPSSVLENFGVSLVAAAFLAGYSVDTAFNILNAIIAKAVSAFGDDKHAARPGGGRRGGGHASERRPAGDSDRPRPSIAAVHG